MVKGDDAVWDTTVNLTRGIFKAYGQWFEQIDHITGNHDDRPAKATQGQIQLSQFFKDLPVEFSEYSYCYLKFPSTGEFTYIAHQYKYSKNSVGLAQQIWTVESAPDGSKRKMHIVIGHTHQEQLGWSPDGNYRCVGLGCMRDPQRTAYARRRATTFHKWNQGFLLIRNGYFYPMSKTGTNWAELLGPELYPLLDSTND